jgi:low affinity Fe/Cu permease
MVKKVKAHHLTVPVFLVFCLAILGLIFGYRANSSLILNVSVMAIFLYMIFAFVHHHFDKTFNLEIVLEYILMAALVLIILVGTFFY